LSITSHPLYRIARNTFSILVGNAGGEILTTYAIVLSASALSPTGFGELATASAFCDPFQTLATFGLGSVTMTIAAQRGGFDGALRGTIRGLTFAFAALAFTLILAFGALTGRGGNMPLLTVAAIGALIAPLTMSYGLPFQYDQAMHRLIAMPFLISIARLGTAYLAYYFLNRPVGYQTSATLAGFLSACVAIYWAHRYYPVKHSYDRSLAKSLLKAAWPIFVLEFVVMLYTRGGYVLLHDAGQRAQGEFAAADRIVRPVLMLASALMVSSLPTVAKLAAAKDFALLRSAYRKAVLRSVAVLIPIAVAVAFLAPWLLRRFLPDYAEATWPLRILLVGALAMFLNQLSSTFIIALGHFRTIMAVAGVNFVVYMSLALSLIPRWGASGAAAATATMELANMVIQIVLVTWLLRAKPAARG